MKRLPVKICGLREPDRVVQAVTLGASYVGFMFYPPSARSLRPDDAASLAAVVPDDVSTVGVFVDPSDDDLATVLAACPLDIIQLHGRETPERTAQVALRTGCRVMKALPVEIGDDLDAAAAYENVADLFLFDAKPPRIDGAIPGGNGLPFDWRLLQGRRFSKPWFLAGGLTAANLQTAFDLVAPPMVDVSSGVERWPGSKDASKLEAFMTAARCIADREHGRGSTMPGRR